MLFADGIIFIKKKLNWKFIEKGIFKNVKGRNRKNWKIIRWFEDKHE
jgi:hypothetical protein